MLGEQRPQTFTIPSWEEWGEILQQMADGRTSLLLGPDQTEWEPKSRNELYESADSPHKLHIF